MKRVATLTAALVLIFLALVSNVSAGDSKETKIVRIDTLVPVCLQVRNCVVLGYDVVSKQCLYSCTPG
jgi:hypothetical protein